MRKRFIIQTHFFLYQKKIYSSDLVEIQLSYIPVWLDKNLLF